MTAERHIFIMKPTAEWQVGDLVPYRLDNAKGEFGGYIKIIGVKPDGVFSVEFIPPQKKGELPA